MSEEEQQEYRTCEGCRESFGAFLFHEDSRLCYLCMPLTELDMIIGESNAVR